MGGGRLGIVTVDNYFKICRLEEGKEILPGGNAGSRFFSTKVYSIHRIINTI